MVSEDIIGIRQNCCEVLGGILSSPEAVFIQEKTASYKANNGYNLRLFHLASDWLFLATHKLVPRVFSAVKMAADRTLSFEQAHLGDFPSNLIILIG